MSPIIGSILDRKLATLYELQTVYGFEDLYDVHEIAIIKVANEQKAYKNAVERAKTRKI